MKSASLFLLAALSLQAAVVFEPNRGQTGSAADFLAHTARGTLGVSAEGMQFLGEGGQRAAIAIAGANRRAPPTAGERAPGVSHYAKGADPARWIWNVPCYQEVRYRGVYPGIDVKYHAQGGEVEFDFLVSAGADPSRIALEFSAPVRLGESGELITDSATLKPPVAWQTVNGVRVPVTAHFALQGESRARLRLGAYDRTRELTIDPILLTASYLGGTSPEGDTRIIAGTDGAMYLAGTTNSINFPAVLPAGSLLNRPEIMMASDVYVTRLRADGTAQDWSLFLGGNGAETLMGLRQDALGNVYVMGSTGSANFPVTSGAYRTAIHSSLSDLFVVKLDGLTGQIKAGTFLGAPGTGLMAVDATGGVYVAGVEYGNALDTTPGAYQAAPAQYTEGDMHFFVLRLNAALTGRVYATLYESIVVAGIDVDDSGNVILGGYTRRDAYLGPTAFQPVNPLPGIDQAGVNQAVVAKLNAAGTAPAFATLIRGDSGGSVADVAFSPKGEIHVIGTATAPNFPLVNPLFPGPAPANSSALFWVTMPSGGGSLARSSLFFGTDFALTDSFNQPARRIALQPDGQPCFLNFGTNAMQQTTGGLIGRRSTTDRYDTGGTLVCLNGAGSAVGVKTMLSPGGPYTSMAVAKDGAAWISGTSPGNFTTTKNALQANYARVNDNSSDAVFMRLSFENPAPQISMVVPESLLLITSTTSNVTIDLYGSGFRHGIEATLNGSPLAVQFVDTGHVILTVSDFNAILPGPNPIVLSLAGPGGGSAQAVYAGINPTPTNVTVSPAIVTPGAGETKLVIRASNLKQTSLLYWNGRPRDAQYVPDAGTRGGHFELLLSAAEVASPMSARVGVSNPNAGGGTMLSAEVFFAVQPATGDGQPTLTASNPLLFGGPTALGPKIQMSGSGFTASTRLYWDGVAVPTEYLSATRINVTPPSADLSRWGVHAVNVTNGAYQSPPLRQFIARYLNGGTGVAADPVRQRLYVTFSTGYFSDTATTDLIIYDLKTGEPLRTVTRIARLSTAITVSTDGSYVYLVDSYPWRVIRFNTETGAVDLQWELPVGNLSATAAVQPVPGSPQSVVVWHSVLGLTIYDGNRPRMFDARTAGYSSMDTPVFVTSSRIYASPHNGSCWQWVEYDALGILPGTPGCLLDPRPDAGHEGGWVWLADGTRTYVAVTPGYITSSFNTPLTFADPARRRLLLFNGQILEYDLDSGYQTLRGNLNNVLSVWQGVDNTAVLFGGNWVTILP